MAPKASHRPVNARRFRGPVGSPENLYSIYSRATPSEIAEGVSWYHRAGQDAVDACGVDRQTACGIVAALSPQKGWYRNIDDAHKFIKSKGRYKCQTKTQLAKARRILRGDGPLEVLRGPKERAFYECMYDPRSSGSVCIDSHAWSAWLGVRAATNKTRVARGGRLLLCQEHYRSVAGRLGLQPHQLQAILWIAWRRIHPLDGPHRLDIARNFPQWSDYPY